MTDLAVLTLQPEEDTHSTHRGNLSSRGPFLALGSRNLAETCSLHLNLVLLLFMKMSCPLQNTR